ncbi:Radical SAM, Pyruvate-formate lyase-activating enzyme like protein [Enhygromyxa salina]|uniref:Radical SAM, Pyruvate-formate lyase-activating enzyme like protein n=1 Tax=Enhygromyxa salina TaxID=215803 RepID=A0A0C2CWC0_9BACT|nr:AmmeMemoRadiSam system radical SAM enzyme [Enhygromyxa salina]KIG13920.1 Radical SAM, Pyruvate-formate lyase-activating enzyme like protein [Enhygromyxa salina]
MPNDSAYPARYWRPRDDGRIVCELCPRDCTLSEGQRGLCFVRQNVGGQMRLTTYGRSSGLCIDPIEKKPLNHFYPGTSVLSLGTAGCNLSCKFCQNWDISKSRDMDTLAAEATPTAIAAAARHHGCHSVAFTYNDPTIFAEYAIDIADACHALGIRTVAVTAGYIHAAPRAEFYAKLDAANVDLKGFSDHFYRKLTGGRLAPVLETLEYLVHETSVWTEITTLVIPEHNDDDAQLRAQCEWIVDRLGPDVPLHFSGFHPDYKLLDVGPTPLATLRRARAIAKATGIRHVYTGNVHDVDGDTTTCGACGERLIVRDWYALLEYGLTPTGECPACAAPLPGRFAAQPGAFGRKRLQIVV